MLPTCCLRILAYGDGIVLYSGSEARSETMTQGTVQLVAGILALALVGIIIMRRKGKKKEEEDF